MTAVPGRGIAIVDSGLAAPWTTLVGSSGTLSLLGLTRPIEQQVAELRSANNAITYAPSGRLSIGGTMACVFKRAAPVTGKDLAVTFANRTTSHVRGWSLTINNPALDLGTVENDDDGNPWAVYVPDDRVNWSGSYDAQADDTNPTDPTDLVPDSTGDTGETLTLKMTDETNDNTFSGTAFLIGSDGGGDQSAGIAQQQQRFQGSGGLTVAGDGNIFGVTATGAVLAPQSAAGQLVFREASRAGAGGRTWAGPALWTSIGIVETANDIVRVNIGWQSAGAWNPTDVT